MVGNAHCEKLWCGTGNLSFHTDEGLALQCQADPQESVSLQKNQHSREGTRVENAFSPFHKIDRHWGSPAQIRICFEFKYFYMLYWAFVLQPIKYSQKLQTCLLVLLVGSVAIMYLTQVSCNHVLEWDIEAPTS